MEPVDVPPFEVNGHAVSVWRLLTVDDDPVPGTGPELGSLLRELHSQPAPPFTVRGLADPLKSVAQAADAPQVALCCDDREWLRSRIHELRAVWSELEPARRRGLIHGDAHTNNLIRTADGKVVLGDWDHAATGPREWDLIQPHYMRRRFDRHTAGEIEAFTETYGWDVRAWAGFATLVEIREVSGLSPYIRNARHDAWARDEAAYRIATLRTHDATARWNTPRSR